MATLALVALYLWGQSVFAERSWLKVQEYVPTPSVEVINAWQNNLFVGPEEIWPILDEDTFLATLKRAGATDELQEWLKSNFIKQLPDDLVGDFFSLFRPPTFSPKRRFALMNGLKKTVFPPRILVAIYSYFFESRLDPPSYAATDLRFLLSEINRWQTSEDFRRTARASIVPWRGNYHLPLNPDNWRLLRPDWKESVIRGRLDPWRPSRRGLSIEIFFNNTTNIDEIAQALGGAISPTAIARYLKRKQQQSGGREVSVPIQEVMPHFIRRHLNTFSSIAGPNCFNCAVSAGLDWKSTPRVVAQAELQKLLSSSYRYLLPHLEPKMGDLLVYAIDGWDIVHTATHVVDDLAFTKNGLSLFRPYIFQRRSTMAEIYQQEGRLQLSIYRPKNRFNRPLDGLLNLSKSVAKPCLTFLLGPGIF